MLAELSPSLAGDTRKAIADHFESSGAIGRASRGLGHPLAHRRAESAALLGDMCSDQAEPMLLLALNDRDPDVRLAATRSLGRLRARAAVIPILHSLACRHVPRAVAANAVLTIGAAALPGIRTLISTEHPATRAAAVELLGRLGNPRDGESLRDRLADEAPLVRERACEALAHLGADDVGQALEDLLADDVRNVRAAAAAALATVGGPRNARAAARDRARRLRRGRRDRSRHALATIAPGLVARWAPRRGRPSPPAPRREHAPGRPGVRTAVEVVGILSVAYAAAINLCYLLLWPLARRGMKKTIRRRGWAWHQEALSSPLTPGVSIVVPAFNEEDGHPRLGRLAPWPALPGLRDRDRRRRVDRRDGRQDDRGARTCAASSPHRGTCSSTSRCASSTAAAPRSTSRSSERTTAAGPTP